MKNNNIITPKRIFLITPLLIGIVLTALAVGPTAWAHVEWFWGIVMFLLFGVFVRFL